MARSRLELHELLTDIEGVKRVYFQPPSNITLEFPCIVYRRASDRTRHADNRDYRHHVEYEITLIDPQPDTSKWDRVRQLPFCRFVRHFTSDKLNHDVFNIFF